MPEIPKQLSKEITDKYSIENNAFRLDKIKNPELDKYDGKPKDEINVFIGDDKVPDTFIPQVKLERWSNETNFSVRLKDTNYEQAEVSTLQNKIKWSKGNTEIEFYDYEEGKGGYKMIPILKAKPKTNQIRFSVKRKGLKFFKQKPLTDEITQEQKNKGWTATETEIKDENGNVVSQRPIDIVNSFAVYHDTKGGMNDKDGKDYKVGKAFHDKRPHFIDAEGKEAWGDLDYIWQGEENGERIVTIPQDFLDNAVYPIRSNDTFGYTSVGESSNSINQTGMGSLFTGGNGTATTISSYCQSPEGWGKAAIYKHSDLTLVVGAFFDVGSSYSWGNYNIADTPITGQEYLLMEGSNSTLYMKFDTGDTNQGHITSDSVYGGATPITITEHNTDKYSIYATYTPSAGSTSPSISPSVSPSISPSPSPSISPSISSSISPSPSPSFSPSPSPSISPSPSPSQSPSASLSPSISPSPSPSLSPSISPSPSPSLSPSASLSPSISPSLSPSKSPSISPSPSPSVSPSASLSLSLSPSPSPSSSPSISPSISSSPSPSVSPSLSPSPSPSASPSISPSPSPSISPSASLSPSISPSPSPSLSPSISPSASLSPSASPSLSSSPSISPSISSSISPSASLSPSISPSLSPSISPSPSPSISPSPSPSFSPSPSPASWTNQPKNTAAWKYKPKNTAAWKYKPKNTAAWKYPSRLH